MYFVLVWLVEGLTMVLANTAAIELQIGTTLYKMSLVITEPHAEYKGYSLSLSSMFRQVTQN